MVKMAKIARKHNLIFQWIFWQFSETPKKILKTWKDFLKFNLEYFSLPLLFKTFFSPWRRYRWEYERGFNIERHLEVFVSNLISRTIGAFLRFFLILFGILSEIIVFFAGAIFFLGWFTLPIILIVSLMFGLQMIF